MWEFAITAGEGRLIRHGMSVGLKALEEIHFDAVSECIKAKIPLSEVAIVIRPANMTDLQDWAGYNVG